MKHFGVNIRAKKYSLRLNRDEFALIDMVPSLPRFKSLVDRNAYDGDLYRLEWCKEYRELCLQNFDLNMKYFNILNKECFEKEVMDFLSRHPNFKEVTNLNDYIEIPGYYMMILDTYKQVYIGKSNNIKRRIMQHWSKVKKFDRTLFPMYAVTASCFSIDFFRALDTTRIYAWNTELNEGLESELVADFPQVYCTNRIGGDVSNGIEAILTQNKRILY